MTILARATVVLGADISALNRKLSEAEQNVVDAGKRIGDIGKSLSMKVTLPLAAVAAVAFKEFAEQVEAMERVRAVIAATGGEAGVTADHIQKLGERLQQTTTFADDVTQGAASLLLMFKNVRNEAGANNDVFDRTVKLAMDLSATLGDDLQSSMLLLGRALEDPGEGLTMLQRRTRAFTDEQQAMIKRLMESGRALEAQKLVLDVLAGRIGGVSERMAKTPLGQFKQMWNELKDALEGVGQVLASIFLPLIRGIRDLAKWFGHLSEETKRFIVIMGIAVAAIGPILTIVGGLIVALPTLTLLFSGLAVPIGLAIIAIGSLIAAGIAVAEHWVWLKQQAVALWTLIKDIFFSGIEFILDQLTELNTLTELIPDWVKTWIPGMGAVTTAMDAVGDAARRMRNGVKLAHNQMLADAGGTLAKLEAELMGIGTAAGGKGDVTGGKKPKPPAWMAALTEASEKLRAELDLARRMEEALGESFDEPAARIKAFGEAIDAAIKAKVPVTNALLQQWIHNMQDATRASEELAFSIKLNLEIEVARITDAIKKAKDPLAEYNRIVADLQVQLALGEITWEQYIERVNAARDAFNNVGEAAKSFGEQVRQGMVDIAGRAIDDFVDSMFDASKSFGEIIVSMIQDIAKLILKLEIMHLLFPNANSEGLGSIFGLAKGGYLGQGQVALVGEQGPELITGGRGGLTVTPMPAMAAAGGSEGGITVPVSLTVAAMDSRDVSRFFQENEAVVATAVTRAVQKSVALRRMLSK